MKSSNISVPKTMEELTILTHITYMPSAYDVSRKKPHQAESGAEGG